MENEKLRIKKGARIFDIMMVMVISFFVIIAFTQWITVNSAQGGLNNTIDNQTRENLASLSEKQSDLEDFYTDFKTTASNNITEAGVYEYAYFGLKAILGLMTLPFRLINIGTDSFSLLSDSIDFVPSEIRTALLMGLSIIIILAVVAFLTNRGREP